MDNQNFGFWTCKELCRDISFQYRTDHVHELNEEGQTVTSHSRTELKKKYKKGLAKSSPLHTTLTEKGPAL